MKENKTQKIGNEVAMIEMGAMLFQNLENLNMYKNGIFEMANYKSEDSGLPHDIWFDELGVERKGTHHTPRVKISLPSKNLIPVSIESKPKILLKGTQLRKAEREAKEKEMKLMFDFISKNHNLILQHWNGKITTATLFARFRGSNIEEEYLTEMAAVKGGFMSIKLAAWGREGNYPHFHFYKGVAPDDGIPNGGEGGGCILIKKERYFIHGTHQDTMNRDEIEALIKFLNSTHPSLGVSIWRYIITLWNDNNPNSVQVGLDTPIPPYYHNMPSVRQ
jgi:hypothetical protein